MIEQTSQDPNRLVQLGVIKSAHGVRGQVKVRSFTAKPDDLTAYGPLSDDSGTRRFVMTVSSHSRDLLIVTIDGVTDRNAAEALTGTGLYVTRDFLPEVSADEYYYVDLIGLRAERPDGTVVGQIAAIQEFGAGDLLEIEAADGGDLLTIRFTRDTVPVVDLEGGRVVIDPSSGIEANERHERNDR